MKRKAENPDLAAPRLFIKTVICYIVQEMIMFMNITGHKVLHIVQPRFRGARRAPHP